MFWPWRPTTPNLKPKNVRIPSHKAPQEPSRRSFGSSFNFRISFFDFSSPFSSRFKNLLSSRTRRGIKKRPLSESAFDTFFVFCWHLMKNLFLSRWHFVSSRFKNLLSSRARRGIKNTLYQNLRSTRFSCFLDILWTRYAIFPTRYAKNLPMIKLISPWLD